MPGEAACNRPTIRYTKPVTVSAAYTALVREVRLANTGQPCGDSFIAGGLECRVGAGDAQRAGSRRTPERQARIVEIQREMKREQGLPQDRSQIPAAQFASIRRAADRRETNQFQRAQRAQAQRPAIQRPEPVAAAHYTVDVLSPRIEAEARAAQLETDRRAEAARVQAAMAAMDGPAAPADGVPAVSASPTLDAAMAATMGRENAARAEAAPAAAPVAQSVMPAAPAAPIPQPPAGWQEGDNSSRIVPAIQAAAAANDLAAVRAVEVRRAFYRVQQWHGEVVRHMEAQADPVRAGLLAALPVQPVFDTANAPLSHAYVLAVREAAGTGNLASVRAISPSLEINQNARDWQDAVIRHMEQGGTPAQAAASVAAPTPVAAAAQAAAPAAAPVAAASPVVAPPMPREPNTNPNHAEGQRYLGRIRSALATGDPEIRYVRMAGSDASRGQYAILRAYHQQLIAHVAQYGLSPAAQAGQAAAPAPAPTPAPAQPAQNPPPAAPPIPTERNGTPFDFPATNAFVSAVNAAIATGDLAAVRAAGSIGSEPLSQHRTWHTNVVAHMEQQAREARNAADALMPAPQPQRSFAPFSVPPMRTPSDSERESIARITAERDAVAVQKEAGRQAGREQAAAITAQHSPAVIAAREAEQAARSALNAVEYQHRQLAEAKTAALDAASSAAAASIAPLRAEQERLRREQDRVSSGVHQTVGKVDGAIVYQPSDFIPTKVLGHNATYLSDTSLERHKSALSRTLGVSADSVSSTIKDFALSMASDLPTQVAGQAGNWQVSVQAGADGSVSLDFAHPGMRESISRTLTMGSNGLSMYHGFFRLNDNAQGDGVSQTLFRQSIGAYERLGVKEVRVSASLTHGGYVWLRHGFVPDEASTVKYSAVAVATLNRLRNQGANLLSDNRHTDPTGRVKNTRGIYNPKTDVIPAPGTKLSETAYTELMKLATSGNPHDLLRFAEAVDGPIKIGAEAFVGNNFTGKIRMGTGDLDRTKAYVMRKRKPQP